MEGSKRQILEKHGYALTGEESGVKLCHWVREKLISGRSCYKEDFYGIQCHRCLQMSPVVDLCNQSCLFCWRYQDYNKRRSVKFDEPEDIVKNSIAAQRELVSGFRGDDRCSEEMWKEARDPNQVAISLAGEPTMYPYLGELIHGYKKRNMTVFLVTNGTFPNALEELDHLPDQLYVTIAAPNEEIYRKLCVPEKQDSWSAIKETLELLPSMKTRTTLRHTLVQNWNIGWESEYAEMVKIAEPDFVEAKGYVFVGDSRRRMNLGNMPSHDTIKEFAKKEGELLGLKILAEKRDSRVVLLGDGKMEMKLR